MKKVQVLRLELNLLREVTILKFPTFVCVLVLPLCQTCIFNRLSVAVFQPLQLCVGHLRNQNKVFLNP